MEKLNFDVVIVGGGVAGMSAAVYAKRRGLNTLILEKFSLGGTVSTLSKISNFPSQTQIDGASLTELFVSQIKTLGVEVIRDSVLSSQLSGQEKILHGKKNEYVCKSVIIATGLSYRSLGIGEEAWLGRGVSFCATCDANFFRGQEVVLASKNGSGLRSARVLSEVCKSVSVCDSALKTLPLQNDKIQLLSGAKVVEVGGENSVEWVKIERGGKTEKMKTSALFVDVGKFADVSAFSGLLVDENGFIKTDENMRTNLPNVFAVGDIRQKPLRQIVTACSDGAIAGSQC